MNRKDAKIAKGAWVKRLTAKGKRLNREGAKYAKGAWVKRLTAKALSTLRVYWVDPVRKTRINSVPGPAGYWK